MEGAHGTCVMCVGDGQCTDLITEAGTSGSGRGGRLQGLSKKHCLGVRTSFVTSLLPPAYPSAAHLAAGPRVCHPTGSISVVQGLISSPAGPVPAPPLTDCAGFTLLVKQKGKHGA